MGEGKGKKFCELCGADVIVLDCGHKSCRGCLEYKCKECTKSNNEKKLAEIRKKKSLLKELAK